MTAGYIKFGCITADLLQSSFEQQRFKLGGSYGLLGGEIFSL